MKKQRLFNAIVVAALALCIGFAAVACTDGTVTDRKELPKTYTVTYTVGSDVTGTAPTETNKKAGDKFAVKSAEGLTKTGYTFDAWNDGSDDYKAGDQYTMPAAAVTFTAKWKEDGGITGPTEVYSAVDLDDTCYIFLYDDNTGKIEYEDGEIALTYTLGGTAITISVAGGGTATGTFADKLLTVNITYKTFTFRFGKKAVVDDKAPTFTFDANGGTGSAPTVTVNYETGKGYAVVMPAADTFAPPDGKTFDKWEISGGTRTDNCGAGKKYYGQANTAYTVRALWKDAVVVDPVPTGKVYNGNCTLPSKNLGNIPMGGETVVKLNINNATLEVYYQLSGGTKYVKATGIGLVMQDKPTAYGDDAYYYKLNIETIAYHILVKSDETKAYIYDNNDEALTNGEFTAEGTVIPPETKYTVTFDPNNEGETWTATVDAGGKVAKPATDPVNASGKAFRYWTDEIGAEYDFNAAVNADIELTAVYAWKVTFAAGEGEGTVEPIWVKNWTAAGVTLPESTGMTCTGKVFAGWNDGTQTYPAGERYTGASGNVTFTAQWSVAALKYNVTFEKSSKYVEIENVTGEPPVVEDKEAGEKFTVPACTYTYTGYTFKEWQIRKYDSKLGWTTTGDTVAAGVEFTMPAYSIKLYAVWEQDAVVPTTAKVTYKAGAHGTGEDVVINDVPLGTYKLITTMPFTVDNFYTCIGWNVEGAAADSKPIAEYNLTADTVFVAQYQNMYYGYDNEFTVEILIEFDTKECLIMGEEVEAMATVSVSGNTITITPEDGAACTGTFINNTLNIAVVINGKTYTFGDPAADTTEYAVTYVLGDGATGTVPTETGKIAGAKFTLAAATGLANGDKVFDGWSDGTTKYAAGAEYTMPAHAVTFTAQWAEQGGDDQSFIQVNLSDLDGKVFDAGKTILSITNFGSTTNYTAARLSYDSNFSSYKLVLIADTSKTSGRTYTQDAGDTATSGTEFVWKDGTITFGFVKVGDKYQLIIKSIKVGSTEKLESPVVLNEV